MALVGFSYYLPLPFNTEESVGTNCHSMLVVLVRTSDYSLSYTNLLTGGFIQNYFFAIIY